MPFILDTEEHPEKNIAAPNNYLAADYVATRDVRVGICLRLLNLATGGANLVIKVETLHSSGDLMDTIESVTSKFQSTNLRYRLEHDRLVFLPQAARMKVYIRSSNTGDTSVDITSFLFDSQYPTVDAEFRDSESPSPSAQQYASGNGIGSQMTFAVGANRGSIVACRVLDKNENTSPLELWLFRASTSGSWNNAPFAPDDTTQLVNLAGVVRIDDWFVNNESSIGQATNLPLAFTDLSSGSVYAWLVSRGTPTYAGSGDLTVQLEVLRD
jgi:hypothetical protein